MCLGAANITERLVSAALRARRGVTNWDNVVTHGFVGPSFCRSGLHEQCCTPQVFCKPEFSGLFDLGPLVHRATTAQAHTETDLQEDRDKCVGSTNECSEGPLPPSQPIRNDAGKKGDLQNHESQHCPNWRHRDVLAVRR
jgi:hypothetical protein